MHVLGVIFVCSISHHGLPLAGFESGIVQHEPGDIMVIVDCGGAFSILQAGLFWTCISWSASNLQSGQFNDTLFLRPGSCLIVVFHSNTRTMDQTEPSWYLSTTPNIIIYSYSRVVRMFSIIGGDSKLLLVVKVADLSID